MRLLILCLFTLTSLTLSAQLVGETENGLASYYSNEYQGAETAYGEIYDRNDLVAAHRLYPQGSTVRVRNVRNNQTVVVRIIDKGPFIKGRIIELSERAAAAIGMLNQETAPVELTLLSTPDQRAVATTTRTLAEDQAISDAIGQNAAPAPRPAERTPVIEPTPPAPASAPASAPVQQPTPAPARTRPAEQPTAPAPTVREPRATVKATPATQRPAQAAANFSPGTYRIQMSRAKAGTFGVQVGSFRDLESAIAKVTELQGRWFDDIFVQRVAVGPTSVYKVILGNYDTRKAAGRYAEDLKSRYKIDGFTVAVE